MAICFWQKDCQWGTWREGIILCFTLWLLFQAVSLRLLSFKRGVGKLQIGVITFIQLLETGFRDPACPCYWFQTLMGLGDLGVVMPYSKGYFSSVIKECSDIWVLISCQVPLKSEILLLSLDVWCKYLSPFKWTPCCTVCWGATDHCPVKSKAALRKRKTWLCTVLTLQDLALQWCYQASRSVLKCLLKRISCCFHQVHCSREQK